METCFWDPTEASPHVWLGSNVSVAGDAFHSPSGPHLERICVELLPYACLPSEGCVDGKTTCLRCHLHPRTELRPQELYLTDDSLEPDFDDEILNFERMP